MEILKAVCYNVSASGGLWGTGVPRAPVQVCSPKISLEYGLPESMCAMCVRASLPVFVYRVRALSRENYINRQITRIPFDFFIGCS